MPMRGAEGCLQAMWTLGGLGRVYDSAAHGKLTLDHWELANANLESTWGGGRPLDISAMTSTVESVE